MRLDRPLAVLGARRSKRFEVGIPWAIRRTPRHSIANQPRELMALVRRLSVTKSSNKLFASSVSKFEQFLQTRSFPTKGIVHVIIVNLKLRRIPLHSFEFPSPRQSGFPARPLHGRPNLLKSAAIVHPGDVDGTQPPIWSHLAFGDADHRHDDGLYVGVPQIVWRPDQIGAQRIENDKSLDLLDALELIESLECRAFVILMTVQFAWWIDKWK